MYCNQKSEGVGPSRSDPFLVWLEASVLLRSGQRPEAIQRVTEFADGKPDDLNVQLSAALWMVS